MKFIAIFASVAAHVSTISNVTPLVQAVTRGWDQFSCISVGGFLICGGILYQRTAGDSRAFWQRKWKTMLLPWLFCGVLTYGYRLLRGQSGSLLGLVTWILGHGSWLYYVTMHVLFLAIFKFFWRSTPALVACVAATALQLLAKTKGGGLPSPLDNDYLNPLHWVGFFALGVLLRRQGLRFSRGFWAVCCLVFGVSAVVVYRDWIYGYFHILNALFSVCAFFVLFGLGRLLARPSLERPIARLGSDSYCIYLWHMLVAPPVLRRIPFEMVTLLLAPALSMGIMQLCIALGRWITEKLPGGERLRQLVGLR